MTKARAQQLAEDASGQPPGQDLGCGVSVESCELLLAKLHASRMRLERLLHLVRMNAKALPAGSARAGSRPRCSNRRIRRIA